jgi:hypothetical protein
LELLVLKYLRITSIEILYDATGDINIVQSVVGFVVENGMKYSTVRNSWHLFLVGRNLYSSWRSQ